MVSLFALQFGQHNQWLPALCGRGRIAGLIMAYPRIKDLSVEEQEPFDKWLTGQTCLWIEGVPREGQDAYYPWDYDHWENDLLIVDQRSTQFTNRAKKIGSSEGRDCGADRVRPCRGQKEPLVRTERQQICPAHTS